MTSDDALAEAVTLSGLSPNEVADLATLSPEDLALALEAYRDADWTQPGTSAGAKFLAALAVVAAIAGAVSGVAGAVSAIQTLAKS